MPTVVTTAAPSFSIGRLVKRLLLVLLAVFLLIELLLWLLVRYPTQPTATIRLHNKIDGLKEKVKITVNHYGLRTHLWEDPKPAGAIRILCVGGTATSGQLQNGEDTWWGQMGAILAKELGVPVQVGANYTVAQTSLEGARWLKDVAPEVRPDLIIANYAATEILSHPQEGYAYSANKIDQMEGVPVKRSGWREGIVTVSQIARWWRKNNREGQFAAHQNQVGEFNVLANYLDARRKEYKRIQYSMGQFRTSAADPAKEYFDALKSMHETAQSLGVPLIFTTEACLLSGSTHLSPEVELCCTFTPQRNSGPLVKIEPQWVYDETRRFQREIQPYIDMHKIPYLDVSQRIEKTRQNFVNETILTDAGAAEVGKLLAPLAKAALQAK